jgi:hypothetical protein
MSEYDDAVERLAATVRLSNGGEALVDQCDYERVQASGRWFKVKKDGFYYVARNFKENERTYLHRFITDAPKGLVVDHINGDTLDNRRSNLRIVAHQNNMRNQAGPQKNNTSGILGVSWHKQRGKWNARIGHNGSKIHLGLFDNLEDATKERRNAETSLWLPEDTFRSRAAGAVKPEEE